MNERRPTSAAGERWRKFGAEPPPLDPDPLTVTEPWDQIREAATWTAAYDEGYDRGVIDSLPPFVVVALVGVTAALLGGMVGWAVGIAR